MNQFRNGGCTPKLPKPGSSFWPLTCVKQKLVLGLPEYYAKRHRSIPLGDLVDTPLAPHRVRGYGTFP